MKTWYVCYWTKQSKLNSILGDLKNNFSEVKAKFTKIEAQLSISRNMNNTLSDKVINDEQKKYANELCSV